MIQSTSHAVGMTLEDIPFRSHRICHLLL